MKISAEEIFSVNQASLKDAIVHFGGGCTGEVVSDKGLILQTIIVVTVKYKVILLLKMII